MNLNELLTYVKRNGILLETDGKGVDYNAPESVITDDFLKSLVLFKGKVIEKLQLESKVISSSNKQQRIKRKMSLGPKYDSADCGVKNDDIFPVMIYSKKLSEPFMIYKDGSVFFVKTNVKYTKQEWKKLDGLSAEEIRTVHDTKSVFEESTLIKVNKNSRNQHNKIDN